MSRNIRDRRNPNRRVVHLTNRCWKGLPFVPNLIIVRILEAVLAKAQSDYHVNIVCYLFMGNHYHIIVAGDATRVSAFVNYLDGEIAKRMMRLFPERWGPRFWAGRYKEQLLPNIDSVISKIAYIFCNPLKARLVSQLKTYPGASSIRSLSAIDHKTAKLCSFTFPRFFKPIFDRRLSLKRCFQLAKELHEQSEGFIELRTDLFGWVHCFPENRTKEKVLDQINRMIADHEEVARRKGVIGAKRLKNQLLRKPFYPSKNRRDRTPFVDCTDEELRIESIQDYRNFTALCRAAWSLVKRGIEATWPRGAFIPGRAFRILEAVPST